MAASCGLTGIRVHADGTVRPCYGLRLAIGGRGPSRLGGIRPGGAQLLDWKKGTGLPERKPAGAGSGARRSTLNPLAPAFVMPGEEGQND